MRLICGLLSALLLGLATHHALHPPAAEPAPTYRNYLEQP